MGIHWTPTTPSPAKLVESVPGNLLRALESYPHTRDMNTTQNVRTGAGTIHAMTIGRTFRQRGETFANIAGDPTGKADCGAQTSSAARITTEATNCPKCPPAAR